MQSTFVWHKAFNLSISKGPSLSSDPLLSKTCNFSKRRTADTTHEHSVETAELGGHATSLVCACAATGSMWLTSTAVSKP